MEPEGSQEHSIGPCSEPDESIPRLPTLFFKDSL
jgi:hypothetical protein